MEVIVGEYHDGAKHIHGFVLQGGSYSSIDYPKSLLTIATGVNSSGMIVGIYLDVKGVRHGFELHGSLFATVDFSGAHEGGHQQH